MNIVIPTISIIIPSYAISLICATVLGFLLGSERALHKKQASFTTFSLLSLGSCVLTHLSLTVAESVNAGLVNPVADPMRIPSYVLSSIGFAAAGIIIFDKKRNNIEGLTTAVMMWLSTALGMCCGFNRIDLAVCVVVLYFLILKIARMSHDIVESRLESEDVKEENQ